MKKFPLNTLTMAIMAAIASHVVSANDDIMLDDLVISAAGFEQKIVDAPSSISVISKQALDKKPYMTVLDAVREVEGVDIGETNDKTGQGGVSMRGMGGDYTLILIDGKRQNNVGDLYPNNFGGNQFNHIPPKEMIERIEVIRGPASTLYGADAMGGVINIITKKVGDVWTGSLTQSITLESNSDFGNDKTTEFALSGPIIAGKLGLAVRGSMYNREASNPEYASVTDPSGTQHNRSLGFGGGGRTVDNDNTNFGGRLTYKINAQQDLTLDYEQSKQLYDNTPREDGTYPLGTLDSVASIKRIASGKVAPRVGYTEEQEFIREQFSLRHEGKWDGVNSDISLHHVQTDNNGRSLPFTSTERDQLQALYDNNGKSWAGLDDDIAAAFLPRPKRILQTRQTTYDAKFDTVVGDHMLVYGGQYLDAEMEDGVFGMTSQGYSTGKVQPHRQWALFVEDNWDIADDVVLTAGIRYDNHNIFGGNTSPRIYTVWQATPNWTIKGGVSTGYKAPKTSDLFEGITGFGGQGTSPFIGTPDLQPETSINTEVAAYFSSARGHNVNVTLFKNDFKDKIATGDAIVCADTQNAELTYICESWGRTTLSQNTNIDRVEIQGVELAGKYQLNQPLSLRANYTFTDSEQMSGTNKGRPLNNTAKHMLNATLDWQMTDKFNTYLTLENRSDRYRDWDTVKDEARYYKSYSMLHVGAGYDISKNISVMARVNNVLDEDFTRYQTSFSDNGDGTYTPTYTDDYNNKYKSRSLWLSATAKF